MNNFVKLLQVQDYTMFMAEENKKISEKYLGGAVPAEIVDKFNQQLRTWGGAIKTKHAIAAAHPKKGERMKSRCS